MSLLSFKQVDDSDHGSTNTHNFMRKLAAAFDHLTENVPVEFSCQGAASNLPSVPGIEIQYIGPLGFPINKETVKSIYKALLRFVLKTASYLSIRGLNVYKKHIISHLLS